MGYEKSKRCGSTWTQIQVSKTKETRVEVSRQHLLDLIKRLGEDVLVQPGKFLFSTIPQVTEVFSYLDFAFERLVKTGLNSNADKDILKKCIQFLSEDLQLRELWYGVVGKEDDELFKASCVLILRRVLIMFVKEQLQLKARKESCLSRHSIKKVKSKKHEVVVENRDKNDEFIMTSRNKLVSP